jgi:hypothetical protein
MMGAPREHGPALYIAYRQNLDPRAVSSCSKLRMRCWAEKGDAIIRPFSSAAGRDRAAWTPKPAASPSVFPTSNGRTDGRDTPIDAGPAPRRPIGPGQPSAAIAGAGPPASPSRPTAVAIPPGSPSAARRQDSTRPDPRPGSPGWPAAGRAAHSGTRSSNGHPAGPGRICTTPGSRLFNTRG